jgi:hypothetical protein
MGDNLQVIVDEMRDELASGSGGFWCIKHDKLARPLFFEVVAAGPSWRVFAECDGRTLLSGDTVEPAALVSDLYVLLRRLIRQLTEPAPKPS